MRSSPVTVPLVVERLGTPEIPALVLKRTGGMGIPRSDGQVNEYGSNGDEDQDIEVGCDERDNGTQQGGRGESDNEDEGTRESQSMCAHGGGMNGDEVAVNPMDDQTEDDLCNPSDTEDEEGPAVSGDEDNNVRGGGDHGSEGNSKSHKPSRELASQPQSRNLKRQPSKATKVLPSRGHRVYVKSRDGESEDDRRRGSKDDDKVTEDVDNRSNHTKAPPKPQAKIASERQWRNFKKQPSKVILSAEHVSDRGRIHGHPIRDVADGESSSPYSDSDTQISMVAAHAHGATKKKCDKAKKFKNDDLPGLPRTIKAWKLHVIPMFRDYTTTLDDPWEITNSIKYAQKLWNTFVPQPKYTLCYMNDPVFYLAVAAFFDQYTVFDNPKDQSNYVVWAVPEPTEEEFDDADPEDLVHKGAFMHECILDTFALYLETVEHLPETQWTTSSGWWPRGALMLSIVAVERAFGQ
ncbi:hypothetical protein PAXINDRAFT_15115 [Paxillus involutus ATCC 200175]|uniref:Uncharacterized protein n=1 Tax=Paxillus involutus ATCC 200175 TaxID=664439 RepID=A0A0C9TXS4_PAXIN|nr:hypothetical protein PAXINDRAFT_15115 [Paxillus involutus ATCC 200175]